MNADLYNRIAAFNIDEHDATLTFTAKLAKENGWSRDYAKRVVEEYKKFAFLAVTASHPVSPSDQVDQAWHLHLRYTHSYWDQFCPKALGRTLHHSPSKGRPTDQAKLIGWYNETLDSYRRFFGHEPATDIWPDASIRFGSDLHFQRVNTKRNWVIAKNPLSCLAGTFGVLSLLTLVFYLSERLWLDPPAEGVVIAGSFLDFLIYHSWIGVALVVLVLLAIAKMAVGRCPSCGKAAAMDKTGKEEDGRQQWQCAYCHHKEWRDETTGGAFWDSWYVGDRESEGESDAGDNDAGHGGGCGGGCGGCGCD